VQTEPGDYPRFYALLRDALVAGGPLPVDPADAVTGLELLERATAS
jgi:scyllo-inositol 2-dehydrogenase (NADP+)